jgi:adenylate cyclase class 2
MAKKDEVEIKFWLDSKQEMERRLKQAGFREKTPRTREINTVYDLPGQKLRRRGELLRLRQYGDEWKLTHKAKGQTGAHKSREETETAVADGHKMDRILGALGYSPSFRYEKFRAEWTDGTGDVVLDETPIGDLGEIEGPARWIDRTAKALGISRDQYNTQSYAELFFDWKKRTKVPAEEMTFKAVRAALRTSPKRATS